MIDTFANAFTWFDGAAVAIILLSALMALSRGVVRALAAPGAVIAALAAAFYANRFLGGRLAGLLPDDAPGWASNAIIIAVAFLAVYVIVRWVGSRLSSTIQGADGVSMVDRLAGLVFGAARGVVAMVFFVLLMNNSIEEDRIPGWIAKAASYPHFQSAASVLNASAPRIAEDIQDNLPDPDRAR